MKVPFKKEHWQTRFDSAVKLKHKQLVLFPAFLLCHLVEFFAWKFKINNLYEIYLSEWLPLLQSRICYSNVSFFYHIKSMMWEHLNNCPLTSNWRFIMKNAIAHFTIDIPICQEIFHFWTNSDPILSTKKKNKQTKIKFKENKAHQKEFWAHIITAIVRRKNSNQHHSASKTYLLKPSSLES